jgi:hypothetical protein
MTQDETDEEWRRKFQNALFRYEKYLDLVNWESQADREQMLQAFFLEGVAQAADATKDMVLEAFKRSRDRE